MRLFAILTLLAALIGLAIAEQVCVAKVYGHMERETEAIIRLVESTPEVDNKADFGAIENRVDAMHKYWQRRERYLGIVIKHIDLSYISDALIYARNFIKSGNKEETVGGFNRLEYLLKSYHNVYGLNGVNIL
jgi:hypothetical protein